LPASLPSPEQAPPGAVASSQKGAVGNWRKILPLLVIAAFFALSVAVISPAGDFPLNDDWSYGEAVRTFLQTGKFVMPTVCAAGFLHILWGSLFCQLAGFSYESLRWSSLVASLLGAWAFYLTLRSCRLRIREALFLSLLYAGNPIMINLAFGFMSDSTALALLCAYFLLLVLSIRKGSRILVLASMLTLLAAISIRQSAVIFALCAPALFLVNWKPGQKAASATAVEKPAVLDRSALILSLLFLVLPLLSASAVDNWLMGREAAGQSIANHYGLARTAHRQFLQSLWQEPGQSWPLFLAACGDVLSYLGIFSLPVLFAWSALPVVLGKKRRHWSGGTGILLLASFLPTALAALITVFQRHRLMPFCENVWRVTSVGAQGIMGIAIAGLRRGHKNFLTALSYLCAWHLLACFLALAWVTLRRLRLGPASYVRSSRSGGGQAALRLVILLSFLAALGFLSVETLVRCTDRYYLIGLVPALMVSGYALSLVKVRLNQPLPWLALSLYLTYSLFAGQDYMASNRARWLCLNRLEASGISFKEIDGGAEYNIVRGLDIYASHYRGAPPRDTWRWWPIRGEKYIVSFSTIPDYDLLFSQSYFSLMTMSEHKVFALKQVEKP